MPQPDTQLALVPPSKLAPFQPVSFEDIERFASLIAESELAPKDYRGKAANVAVAVLMGRELGIPPMQAIQGIAVINGRPSVWGDLMWAIVTSHPDFQDCPETVDDNGATCTLKRRGRTDVVESFTVADAQRAGLWGKAGPWTQYPKRMMMWRARTFAARRQFADALKGIQTREEVQDYIDGEVVAPNQAAIPTIAYADPAAGTKAERPESAQMDTTGHAEPEKGAAAEEKVATVSTAQSAEWNAAAKKNGRTAAERSAYLRDVLQQPKTTAVPVERFAEMMAWANTPAAPPEQSAEERFCRQAWAALMSSPADSDADIAQFTKEGVTDWETLGMELHSRREAKGV